MCPDIFLVVGLKIAIVFYDTGAKSHGSPMVGKIFGQKTFTFPLFHTEQVDDGRASCCQIPVELMAGLGGGTAVAYFQESSELQVADTVECGDDGQAAKAVTAFGIP